MTQKKKSAFDHLDLPELDLNEQSLTSDLEQSGQSSPVTVEPKQDEQGFFKSYIANPLESIYEHGVKRPSVAVAQGMADTIFGEDSLAKASAAIETGASKLGSFIGEDSDQKAIEMMNQADIAAGKKPIEAKGDIGLSSEQMYQQALKENQKQLREYEKTSKYDVPLISDLTGYQFDTSSLGKMAGGAAAIEGATTAAISSLPALSVKYGKPAADLIKDVLNNKAPWEVVTAVRAALGGITSGGLKATQLATKGFTPLAKSEELKDIPIITDVTGIQYDPEKMRQIKTATMEGALLEALSPNVESLAKTAFGAGKQMIKGLQKAENPTLRQMAVIAEEGYKYPKISDSSREALGIRPTVADKVIDRPMAKSLIKEKAVNTLYDEFDDMSQTILKERDELVKDAVTSGKKINNSQTFEENPQLKEIMFDQFKPDSNPFIMGGQVTPKPMKLSEIADKYFDENKQIVSLIKDTLESSSNPEMYLKNLKVLEDQLFELNLHKRPKYQKILGGLKSDFNKTVAGYDVFDKRLNNLMSNLYESLINVEGKEIKFSNLSSQQKTEHTKKALHDIIEAFAGDRAAQGPARTRLAKVFDDFEGSLIPLFKKEAESVSQLKALYPDKTFKVKFPGVGELPDQLVNDLVSNKPEIQQKAQGELKKLLLDYNERIEDYSTRYNAAQAVRGQPTDTNTGIKRAGLSAILGVGGETVSALSKGATRAAARGAGYTRQFSNYLDKLPSEKVMLLAENLEKKGYKEIADIWRKSLDSRTGVNRNSAMFITLSNPKYRQAVEETQNEQLDNNEFNQQQESELNLPSLEE